MASASGVSVSASNMATLLPIGSRFVSCGRLVVSAREASDQLLEERALAEVLSQARMRGRDAIERQHLLHGICIAEEHHDFFQVRAAHGVHPAWKTRHTHPRVRVHLTFDRARPGP
jgi:hypothetical protein